MLGRTQGAGGKATGLPSGHMHLCLYYKPWPRRRASALAAKGARPPGDQGPPTRRSME